MSDDKVYDLEKTLKRMAAAEEPRRLGVSTGGLWTTGALFTGVTFLTGFYTTSNVYTTSVTVDPKSGKSKWSLI